VTVSIRVMTEADILGASKVHAAGFEDLDRRDGIEPHPITDAGLERIGARHRHFLLNDPAGSFVAVEGDLIVGCALALKRDRLWGLSLLVVDPAGQSAGTGRRLLDASLAYAEGCDRAIILSTLDPRAMRCYATSGFAMYPQVHATGEPDRTALPSLHRRVRDGSLADIEFADQVDRIVRGAPRGPDHVLLASDMPLFVVDDVDGSGYAYLRSDGEVFALAATNDTTATDLLWRCLAHVAETGGSITVENLNAVQQWAIATAYRARLKVTPSGPAFWRGITPPPSYLPSGAYL
jgi:GNAT superfamily N-acetyltransferase